MAYNYVKPHALWQWCVGRLFWAGGLDISPLNVGGLRACSLPLLPPRKILHCSSEFIAANVMSTALLIQYALYTNWHYKKKAAFPNLSCQSWIFYTFQVPGGIGQGKISLMCSWSLALSKYHQVPLWYMKSEHSNSKKCNYFLQCRMANMPLSEQWYAQQMPYADLAHFAVFNLR